MRNIAMIVGYDGTNYEGFQSQPSLQTVQDELEKAILHLTGESTKIQAASRTDSGVHARAQVFNFITESRIPIERWRLAMNTRLPDDIVIRNVIEVPLSFHARKSTSRKTYRYAICNSPIPNVFEHARQLHFPRRLDVEAMREGLLHLVGEHDFTSYCSRRTTKDSKVRTIWSARIETDAFESGIGEQDRLSGDEGKMVYIYVTGNGFLYNMVRIIVGTLLKVGLGRLTSEDMLHILLAKDRSKAGPTAVAKGLTLWDLQYEDPLVSHTILALRHQSQQ